jgi:hypothetical protein
MNKTKSINEKDITSGKVFIMQNNGEGTSKNDNWISSLYRKEAAQVEQKDERIGKGEAHKKK